MQTWMPVESPLGRLTLVGSSTGLTNVYFSTESPDLSAMEPSPALADAARQITEYFAGQRTSFSLKLDLPTASPLPFRARAQRALSTIPFGERWTYAQLARAAGSAGAVRAAGSACATNPLPIVVPCHRVVRADGTIGSYRGGSEAKRFLLDHESAIRATQ